MSQFQVKVVTISDVSEHPNADALEIAHIDGSMWQTVVAKGKYSAGDIAIYVPVEALLPVDVSDRWGVTQYLSKQRVRAARLRGEMSYGFLVDATGFSVGDDLTEHFGITKYEPPVKLDDGDMDRELATFPMYTDIENVHNFPNLFEKNEMVVVTEKLHGTNSRVGYVLDENGEPSLVCGSRTHRRKLGMGSMYELPLLIPEVTKLLLAAGPNTVLFGEIFGGKVQGSHFSYGSQKPTFKVFDIWQDGSYLSHDDCLLSCDWAGIEHVPVLAIMAYDIDAIKSMTCGPSSLHDGTIREGVVIKPTTERNDPSIGRVILKFKGDDFLLNKHSH